MSTVRDLPSERDHQIELHIVRDKTGRFRVRVEKAKMLFFYLCPNFFFHLSSFPIPIGGF